MAQNRNRVRRVGAGQNSRLEAHGSAAFTTTGTSKTIKVPFGRVEAVFLTYQGTVAVADGPLSTSNTLLGTVGENDSAMVGTNGNTDVVVTRVAGTTSGAKFFWKAIGY